MTDTPTNDDCILPFQIETSEARGRLIRLGATVSDILARHDYPEPVSALLGEAIVLAAMLGASLKIDGKFILQANLDGPVRFVVAQFSTSGALRGYASFDGAAFAEGAPTPTKTLLRGGHLIMTIDQGPDTERYQGVVALKDASLTAAADHYFRQSEQIPTFLKVAVARHFEAAKDDKPGRWSWRAGGLMVQRLSQEGGTAAPSGDGEHDTADAWDRARLFASTVEDHELLDPTLTPERLLYRLFNEERVRVFPSTPLVPLCQCSTDRVHDMLAAMSPDERAHVAQDGRIHVTCEFCNRRYEFGAADFGSA